jgi:hypothetical protein
LSSSGAEPDRDKSLSTLGGRSPKFVHAYSLLTLHHLLKLPSVPDIGCRACKSTKAMVTLDVASRLDGGSRGELRPCRPAGLFHFVLGPGTALRSHGLRRSRVMAPNDEPRRPITKAQIRSINQLLRNWWLHEVRRFVPEHLQKVAAQLSDAMVLRMSQRKGLTQVKDSDPSM